MDIIYNLYFPIVDAKQRIHVDESSIHTGNPDGVKEKISRI